MIRIRDLHFATLLLAILATVSLAAAAAIFGQPTPNPFNRPKIQWSPDLTLTPQSLDNANAPIEFKEALTRPLFRISRRPFDPAKVAAAEPVQPEVIVLQPPELPAPPDASQLIVKGILINDQKQLALIATAEAPEGTWLAPGAEISGWTIADMNPDGVTLRAAANVVKLKLYVDNH